MANKHGEGSTSKLIDENLKRVYQEALEEELPDRFKDLLSQLKAKDAGNRKESNQ